MNEKDFKGRKVELTTRDANPFWLALRFSLNERVQDLQARIFNLKCKDEELEAARVEHSILLRLESGELLDVFVKELDGKIDMEDEENPGA